MLRSGGAFLTLTIALSAASPVLGNADQSAHATPTSHARANGPSYWQAHTRDDISAYAKAARENYIYAVYPRPEQWERSFKATLEEVQRMVPLVHDAAGYQAVMKYLSVTFHDAHVGIRFTMPPLESRWPGFLARFDNGRYRITASRTPGIANDTEITECDGKPIGWWIDTIAHYEIGRPVALETTRMIAALQLSIDRGSPLRPHPSHCVIGGHDVPIDWSATPKDVGQIMARWQGVAPVHEASTRLVGDDGAWVKLGFFEPDDEEQAKAFHAAIDAATGLRDKKFIVLDVRGNGGGPYNWFMGYLRGLYGQAYADYHATARLRIRAVYRISNAADDNNTSDAAAANAFDRPADPPYEGNDAATQVEAKRAVAAKRPWFREVARNVVRDAPSPPNPVRARVFVLTDYGCASACIGFVDELKLFPGVQQIGLPTAVDSRSGTAAAVPLPGGRATAYIATMTRDGRDRGDNVSQDPSIRFTGNIQDDKAVQDWVLRIIASPVVTAPKEKSSDD